MCIPTKEHDIYINLTKQFLIYKFRNLDKSKVKDSFDDTKSEDEILESTNIEDLHKACKNISSKGLKQVNTLFIPIKNFYEHLLSNNESLMNVDTEYLKNYINKTCIDLEISYGTRSNYKSSLVAFLKYIDSDLKYDKKFNIEKFKVVSVEESSKSNDKLIDWLDLPTFKRVNKEILKYPYKDYESIDRYKDILIFRLFCFSGILPNEMASLTLDSFIFRDNMMFLEIKGITKAKNREIPLPKEKLIRYYNKYIELRKSNVETFFYNKSNKKIEESYLSEVVKKYLEFCKLDDIKDKTPKMLRKTYALLLNNIKGKDGFTQPEQNIKYLLGLANTTQLREILKYGTIDVVTASSVFEDLEI